MRGSAPGAAATVVLGRVLGAFGIRGWIKIRPFTESPESLLSQAVWVLSLGSTERLVQVEEARAHGAFVLAQLKGIKERGQAEALRGADITVTRDQLPAPEAGEYYWSDLIGLSVCNLQGIELGRVTGLIAAPAHDVLRVVTDQGKDCDQFRERLIPFVEPILHKVDLAGGWVTVDWEADY